MKRERLLASLGSLCLALVLVVLLFTAGCTESTPEHIELSCAIGSAASGAFGDSYNWWANEVEKRTNGAVTIKIYWGGTLAKREEIPEAVKTGTADIGVTNWGLFGAAAPLYSVADQPIAFWNKPLAAWMAAEQLEKEFPEFEQVLTAANMKRLNYYGMGVFHTISKKPVRNLQDFAGLKIGCSGGAPTMFEAVGATPVSSSVIEAYDQLDKGVIDAYQAGITMIASFNFYDVAKYLIKIGMWGNPAAGAMINLDVWNNLSPDVQQVFMELREEFPVIFAEGQYDQTTMSLSTIEEAVEEVIDLPAADLETWGEMPQVKSKPEDWLKSVSEQSKIPEPRFREMLERYQELLPEYAERYPIEF